MTRFFAQMLLLFLLGATAHAATPACRSREASPPDRPRVGLVLGGGGARGFAHIAVLRGLEQLHVPIDCIAGTSMGAVIGGMYATGLSIDEIERTVLALDWNHLFDDALARPERTLRRKRDDELVVAQPGIGIGKGGVKIAPGLLGGERILLQFERWIEPVATIEDFDRLPIPFRAVASDLNDGSMVVLDHGDLALALRASLSIPGAFPPVDLDGKVLVDGGIARNLPIDVAREMMGADIVIAVDVGTPLGAVTPHTSVLGVADQLTSLLTVRNTKDSIATLRSSDVLIAPPLGARVATGDFTRAAEAIAIGREGFDAQRALLAALSLGEPDYARSIATRTGRATAPPVIEFVRLDNRTRYRDAVFLARLDVPLGKPLDASALERQVHALYGFSTLALSTYEVVEESGRAGVVVHVAEKSQGPTYFETGLSIASDFTGRFDFNFRLGLLRAPVNDVGGEVRGLVQIGDEPQLLTEYYQPFGALGRWQVATRALYEDRSIDLFDSDGHKLAEYGARQVGLGFLVGREFGNTGAVALGVRRATGSTFVRVGDPTLSESGFDVGETWLEATVDRLDSAFFPRDGYLVTTRYLLSREALGADTDFEQLDFDAIGARTYGAHALQLGLRYHATTSGVAPVQSVYRVGGFSRLAGFRPNELSGQDYAVALAGYSYKLGEVLGQKALAGATLEYGNAWQRRADMGFDDAILNASAYLGLDTALGPVLFGVGLREGGKETLFLTVGQRF